MNLDSAIFPNFGSGFKYFLFLYTRFFRGINYSLTLGFLAPYLLRPRLRASTPTVSNTPRTTWYRTPGKSFTRPPRITTIECSCKLCPSPGIYAVTSPPLVRRTRATLRNAEFGFFGVTVVTFIQTPRLNGDECILGRFLIVLKEYAKTGALFFLPMRLRGFLINCRNVGILKIKN